MPLILHKLPSGDAKEGQSETTTTLLASCGVRTPHRERRRKIFGRCYRRTLLYRNILFHFSCSFCPIFHIIYNKTRVGFVGWDRQPACTTPTDPSQSGDQKPASTIRDRGILSWRLFEAAQDRGQLCSALARTSASSPDLGIQGGQHIQNLY